MQGALFMPARCVVLHGGNTGKVRVISDGWVLAGFEGFEEGREKSFPFIDCRALFWYLLVVVYVFCRVGSGASRYRGVLTLFWGTGHVHLEGRKRLRAHHKRKWSRGLEPVILPSMARTRRYCPPHCEIYFLWVLTVNMA